MKSLLSLLESDGSQVSAMESFVKGLWLAPSLTSYKPTAMKKEDQASYGVRGNANPTLILSDEAPDEQFEIVMLGGFSGSEGYKFTIRSLESAQRVWRFEVADLSAASGKKLVTAISDKGFRWSKSFK